MKLPTVPLWLALLGLIGNTAVAAVLFERGENQLWPIFVVAIVISYGACFRAAATTETRGSDHRPPLTKGHTMIAATFHGSSYSPPNYDFDTIHIFDTLEEVIEGLFERYTANGEHLIDSEYLDGHTESVYWPTVGAGDYFTCYRIPDWNRDEQYHPDELEGYRLEAHTAVHGGWKDYTVTLAESEQDHLIVTVERAGI